MGGLCLSVRHFFILAVGRLFEVAVAGLKRPNCTRAALETAWLRMAAATKADPGQPWYEASWRIYVEAFAPPVSHYTHNRRYTPGHASQQIRWENIPHWQAHFLY